MTMAPGCARPIPTTAAPYDPLEGVGALLFFLAALIATAAVIAGIVLLSHKTCGTNPYYTSMTDCDFSSGHPFTGPGWAILVGGLVQATVVGVLGHVTRVCGRLRLAAKATGVAE